MAIGPRLDLRQSQNLSLTPQLVQAIKLLAMPTQEIMEYVAEEVAQNPFLEMADAGTVAVPEHAAQAQGEKPQMLARDLETVGFTPMQNGAENQFDEDWHPRGQQGDDDSFGLSRDNPYWSETPYMDFGDESAESNWAEQDSLHDVLMQQTTLEVASPAQRMIAVALIEGVNDAGYLTVPVEDIAARLGVDESQVEAMLAIMQRFEPAGVFARTLEECLRLQLREKNRLDPLMEGLLVRLELVAKKDFATLKKQLKVDDEDLHDMLAELRALTPKPGLNYGGGIAQTLVPDVFVIPTPDGEFRVELNPDALPKVLVNNRYYTRVNTKDTSKEAKQFLQTHYASAQWLHKALDQRAKTIVKVSAEIVRQQEAFFRQGVLHLRPLTLKTVAEAIEMHESTVSRVTTGKYMASARGVFEMKYFFTSSITNEDGSEGMAAQAVQQKIKQLIDAEAADAILSDETIAAMLNKDGIEIARRTVMKYRETMNIGSSVERRREKKMRG